MKLVIPYKFNHDKNGLELKYAIRSIHKHFSALSSVLLVGDCPDWFAGEYIECGDLMKQKERSMMLKILCADIKGPFLYSNDDFFALEDFSTYLPNYFDITCGEMARLHKVKKYRDMYLNCCLDWNNYDVHCPMIMYGERFKEKYLAMTDQLPIKTMYANDLEGVRMADCKIQGEHTIQEIEFKLRGRMFFSTKEDAINAEMMTILYRLYPQKSPYEKG